MDLKKIDASLAHLSDMVSMGALDEAFNGAEALYAIICYLDKNAIYFTVLSNLASIYIDIGAMKPCKI